jgi:ribosome-associated toxin RatA of RatAB toxin-antitoxin module
MHAPPPAIYAVAAEVERWPEILSHYRWVTLLERDGDRKLVEMAATRDGFPVKWQAVQHLFPAEPRITFRHVQGVTRGMDVAWSFHPAGTGTLVRISHDLTLRWPLIGGWAADRVIGPLFVENIAGKTLRRIKQIVERLT